MGYERVYVYKNYEDIVVVVADSKEQAQEKIKERFGGIYNARLEDIKTLDEFIEQFRI